MASQLTLVLLVAALAGAAAIAIGTPMMAPARATLATPRTAMDCLRCLPRIEAISLSAHPCLLLGPASRARFRNGPGRPAARRSPAGSHPVGRRAPPWVSRAPVR